MTDKGRSVGQAGPRQRKILLADDDAGLRRLIEATLASDEYRILEAATGAQALAVARREQPDLVLLDVNMPGGLNGLEVCQRLKSDSGTAAAAVSMLTAAVDDEQRRLALAYGAVDYITKPFSPLALLTRLEALFEAPE
jgi:two-component system phosphate regulon response regulator PhoB